MPLECVYTDPMKAVVGGTVTLPCFTTLVTPVDWYYQHSVNDRGSFLCSAGYIATDYSRRFALSVRTGDYSLTIRNVTHPDAGVYTCREDAGLGNEHRILLIVHGKISISEFRVGDVELSSKKT